MSVMSYVLASFSFLTPRWFTMDAGKYVTDGFNTALHCTSITALQATYDVLTQHSFSPITTVGMDHYTANRIAEAFTGGQLENVLAMRIAELNKELASNNIFDAKRVSLIAQRRELTNLAEKLNVPLLN